MGFHLFSTYAVVSIKMVLQKYCFNAAYHSLVFLATGACIFQTRQRSSFFLKPNKLYGQGLKIDQAGLARIQKFGETHETTKSLPIDLNQSRGKVSTIPCKVKRRHFVVQKHHGIRLGVWHRRHRVGSRRTNVCVFHRLLQGIQF